MQTTEPHFLRCCGVHQPQNNQQLDCVRASSSFPQKHVAALGAFIKLGHGRGDKTRIIQVLREQHRLRGCSSQPLAYQQHIHPQFCGRGEPTGCVEVNQSRSTKYGRNGTRSQRKGALAWPRKPEIGRRPDEWDLYHKELIRIASISCLLICQECPCQHQ